MQATAIDVTPYVAMTDAACHARDDIDGAESGIDTVESHPLRDVTGLNISDQDPLSECCVDGDTRVYRRVCIAYTVYNKHIRIKIIQPRITAT